MFWAKEPAWLDSAFGVLQLLVSLVGLAATVLLASRRPTLIKPIFYCGISAILAVQTLIGEAKLSVDSMTGSHYYFGFEPILYALLLAASCVTFGYSIKKIKEIDAATRGQNMAPHEREF
ncbi:MAG TPA: hypothetical protein VGL56_17240 [Fimbriimonadaceae bacterium]|jgi:hypothetical protein